jgi:Rad3-related DNA helicase
MTTTLAPVQSWDDVQELFAQAMPGYQERTEQTRLAHTIEAAFTEDGWLMAQAGCGCIQGDAEIVVNRGGNGRRMTMRELVVRFNGGRTKGQQRYWDPKIPTYVQREVDGIVRLGRVLHAWFSGVKTTYTVTTNTGRTVRATDEHPFLTERGWLRLDELKVGDELHVRGEQALNLPRKPKAAYKRICVLAHPYRNQKTVPEHRLVVEADLNGMSYPTFLATVRSGAVDGLVFLNPDEFHVHHKDHNPFNNDLSNLQVMTPTEHHRLHAEEGKTNSVLYKVVTETVESVELFGEEETFDIEVADDPHNFIVNGFVVHNTGKSFAGLVPAILWALRTGQTVAVATATKALQTQYATKDLPFLAELFAAAGVPFTWSVLKGRGSYICKSKLNDSELTADDVFNLAALKEELENETHTGDLDDLVTQFDLKQKSKITSSSDECPGKDECPFGDVCFAEGAKARAKKAHIVVVNHSVLVTDALLRMKSNGQISLLPEELGAVIIDEAHELCSYTSSALGSRITRGTFRSFGRDVARWLGGDERAAGNLYRANDELFIALSAVLKRNRAVRIRPEDDRVMLPVLKALTSVKDEIKHLVEDLRAVEVRGDDRKLQARKRLVKRARSLTEKVVEVATAESDVLVRWVSQEFTAQGEDVVLEFAPLHVGDFLTKNVWHSPALYDEDGTQIAPPTKRAVVLMSATLAVGSDFSFLAKTLGLSDYTGFDAGTPFDFAKQAAVYVPKPKSDANPRGFADPTKDVATWRTQAQRVMRELITAAGRPHAAAVHLPGGHARGATRCWPTTSPTSWACRCSCRARRPTGSWPTPSGPTRPACCSASTAS